MEDGSPHLIHFTPGQRAFIEKAIATGRLQTEDDAIAEALALWEERERYLDTLPAVAQAEASPAAATSETINRREESRLFFDEIKEHLIARFRAVRNARR